MPTQILKEKQIGNCIGATLKLQDSILLELGLARLGDAERAKNVEKLYKNNILKKRIINDIYPPLFIVG